MVWYISVFFALSPSLSLSISLSIHRHLVICFAFFILCFSTFFSLLKPWPQASNESIEDMPSHCLLFHCSSRQRNASPIHAYPQTTATGDMCNRITWAHCTHVYSRLIYSLILSCVTYIGTCLLTLLASPPPSLRSLSFSVSVDGSFLGKFWTSASVGISCPHTRDRYANNKQQLWSTWLWTCIPAKPTAFDKYVPWCRRSLVGRAPVLASRTLCVPENQHDTAVDHLLLNLKWIQHII